MSANAATRGTARVLSTRLAARLPEDGDAEEAAEGDRRARVRGADARDDARWELLIEARRGDAAENVLFAGEGVFQRRHADERDLRRGRQRADAGAARE